MNRMGCAAWLAAALLLTGCGGQSSQTTAAGTEANAETTAREVLTELYSAGAQDSSDFEEALARSATGESALDDYLVGKVGDKLSDEGRNDVLDNRVLSRVFNAWPATEVTAQDITLDELGSADDTARQYTYTVTAGPEGEDTEDFTGQIALTLTDGVWMVTGMN